MRSLELVEAQPLDAAGQMGLDEALLSAAPEGRTLLRFYRWARPGVTFGYSQRWQLASEMARARGMAGADVVRRATGGGVVFHDGDLTFSLVFPWERLSTPRLIYKDIHRAVHLGLTAAGVLSRIWAGAPRVAEGSVLEKACFGGEPELMDIVRADGLKILGGALRRRGTVGLYQGSFRPDLVVAAIAALQNAIADGLTKGFGTISLDIPANSFSDAERFASKYRSDRWNKRR